MGKHLQIRDLPEETHRALKIRAAEKGMSMSDYVKALIDQSLKRPNWAAINAELASAPTLNLKKSTTELIREDRDSR